MIGAQHNRRRHESARFKHIPNVDSHIHPSILKCHVLYIFRDKMLVLFGNAIREH